VTELSLFQTYPPIFFFPFLVNTFNVLVETGVHTADIKVAKCGGKFRATKGIAFGFCSFKTSSAVFVDKISPEVDNTFFFPSVLLTPVEAP
jgi:hypothetical protein